MSFVNAPVHDLLIRIKNAYMARRYTVENVLYSKFKVNVLDLLQRYNFVVWYDIVEDGNKKSITVNLLREGSLAENTPTITFYSKPSRRRYVGWKELRNVAWGVWIWIVSTNQWLMATLEAKKRKIWWELIAEIY